MKAVVRQMIKINGLHANLARQTDKNPDDLKELHKELKELVQMMSHTCPHPRQRLQMQALDACETVLQSYK
jgi:hypothetical protein